MHLLYFKICNSSMQDWQGKSEIEISGSLKNILSKGLTSCVPTLLIRYATRPTLGVVCSRQKANWQSIKLFEDVSKE